MSLPKLVYLYRGWLRARVAREALAAFGVMVGVALVLATLTANQSVLGSSSRIVAGLAGRAQLQGTALASGGIPEVDARRRRLPGVLAMTGVLQAPVALEFDGRRVGTQVIGVQPGIVALNDSVAGIPFRPSGLVLPAALAEAVGVHAHELVRVEADGRSVPVKVQAVLGSESIGSLSSSLVAFGYLRYVQRLLGLPGRVSTVLVRARRSQLALARRSLAGAFGPALRVSSTLEENGLLARALRPQDQSTSFFVLIGVLVGVLLIVTTIMLTSADRRHEIRVLRLQGYSRRQLAAIIAFQGVVLGGVSALVGVFVGVLLAHALGAAPLYLASAFPLGSGTVVSSRLAVLVWGLGTLLTTACVCGVLSESGLRWRLPRAALLTVSVLLLSVLAVWLSARRSLFAAPVLAADVLMLVMPVLDLVRRACARVAGSSGLNGLVVATGSVRAAPVRSAALAATAAIGVFGAVIAVDVHRDLLSGLEGGYERYVGSADVWVTSPTDDLATSSLPAAVAAKARLVPGVRSVRAYYGGFLDMDGRRIWLISRVPGVPPGQTVRGSHGALGPGEIGVSDQLARELGWRVGEPVSIPTPDGRRSFVVTATTTNLGWSSGVLFLPVADYARDWGATRPTAFEVMGSAAAIVRGLRGALGDGVSVQSAKARAAAADALPRQGLERLSQIAWLLVIAAAVAVALALSSMVWQRRSEMASLRLQSFTPSQLQRVLGWEALLIIGAGVLLGVLVGSYGHFAADGYLRAATGYPVAHGSGDAGVLLIAGLVLLVTALILAVPGYRAVRAPLRLALDGR